MPDRSTADGEFGFSDLVGAWRGRQRWARAHPDLAKFHEARYLAFRLAFDVDLEHPPNVVPAPPAWLAAAMADATSTLYREHAQHRWPKTLIELARGADRTAQRLSTPFAGYLETPLAVAAASTRYRASIAAPVSEAQQAVSRMIIELFAAVHPEAAAKRVSADDLRRTGFDPDSPAPDPDDYW